MIRLVDQDILKAFAVDIFAAVVGVTIIGLPLMFIHGTIA